MTDLMKIDTTFGELDQVTQWALRGAHASGFPIEQKCDASDWYRAQRPSWSRGMKYRLKPKPIKKSVTFKMGVAAFQDSYPLISNGHYETEGWHKGVTTVHFEDENPVRIEWVAT